VTGFVLTDTLANATTGSETFSTTATNASNVGSYGITGSGLTANHGNYVFAQAAGNATALTINPATLTVSANAASRTYGAANPALSGSVTGFVLTDTLANATTGSETFSTTATNTSNVGSYGITGSGLTANNGNYVFAQAAGNATALTINKADLTATANAFTKTYDGSAYHGGNGVAYSGFVNGETSSVLNTTNLGYGGNSQGAINSGNYAIVANGVTSGNYNLVYAAGNLHIVPLVLGGESFDLPTIPTGLASSSITSNWPVSIRPISQLSSVLAEVVKQAPGILTSSNDSVSGVPLTILDGGIRLPDDSLMP
jgi:hypothetical protein